MKIYSNPPILGFKFLLLPLSDSLVYTVLHVFLSLYIMQDFIGIHVHVLKIVMGSFSISPCLLPMIQPINMHFFFRVEINELN